MLDVLYLLRHRLSSSLGEVRLGLGLGVRNSCPDDLIIHVLTSIVPPLDPFYIPQDLANSEMSLGRFLSGAGEINTQVPGYTMASQDWELLPSHILVLSACPTSLS